MRPLPALVLPLACAAALSAGDAVPLERKSTPGARARVQERTRSEVAIRFKNREAAVGESEVTEVVRRYLEEVRAAQPETLWREYELSTRAKARRGSPLPEPERTSYNGRAVLVSGLEQKPDGPWELSKDDREALRLDRLAQALLPPARAAERGQEWVVPAAALGKALFGEWVPEANLEGSGARVRLEAVKREGKRDVAQLKVKAFLLRMARTEALPGLELGLKGELGWDVAEGRLVMARLEGPLTWTMGDGAGEGQATATGTLSWTLTAEVLEPRPAGSDEARARGDPPPPGTQHLVCKKDPAHAYGIPEVRCCLLCGAELDADKVCKQHGWALRFCPRDGAPLEPR